MELMSHYSGPTTVLSGFSFCAFRYHSSYLYSQSLYLVIISLLCFIFLFLLINCISLARIDAVFNSSSLEIATYLQTSGLYFSFITINQLLMMLNFSPCLVVKTYLANVKKVSASGINGAR